MGKVAWRTGWRTAALSVLLGVALAAAAAQAQAVTIHELYAGLVGTGAPESHHGRAGRQPVVHRAQRSQHRRITPAGDLTEFFLTPNSSPEGITVGPNGRLWFTEPGWDRIGRITPAGVADGVRFGWHHRPDGRHRRRTGRQPVVHPERRQGRAHHDGAAP